MNLLPKDAFKKVTDEKESVAISKVLEATIKKVYSNKIFHELYQIYLKLSEQFKANQEKLVFRYLTYEGVNIQDQPLVPKKIISTSSQQIALPTASVIGSLLKPQHMYVQCIKG